MNQNLNWCQIQIDFNNLCTKQNKYEIIIKNYREDAFILNCSHSFRYFTWFYVLGFKECFKINT